MAIKLRRDSAADWTSNNPTLEAGQPGYETDTGKLKIGDGSTAWTSLAYTRGSFYTRASSSSAASLELFEDTDNGTNKTTLIGAAAMGADRTITLPDATGTVALTSDLDGAKPIQSFDFALSDETTDLTTGTAKVTFRMPYPFTITEVRASVNTAPVGSTIIVDINEGGASILSTKLSIDASEKTSVTAATPPVISDSSLADDAEITLDIDQVGSSTAGKGLKVSIIGRRA